MNLPPPILESHWNTVPPDAQAALLAVLDAYQQRIAELEKRLRDLEARLKLNSTNSSKLDFCPFWGAQNALFPRLSTKSSPSF